jgi:outer membrane protein OmpU
MNKLKKIGLTALAASLVSTSVFAGEMTVSSSASITVENYSIAQRNSGKGFSMGNQITFSGSGELDNGLNVSVSFVIDEFDGDTTSVEGPADGSIFDAHSVTVSSDALGTLVFSGEGGSSAQSALDTTAAGDIWDTFDGTTGTTVFTSTTSNNTLLYTLPSIVDGLSVSASYVPQAAGAASSLSYAAAYTGIDGLSVSYGVGEQETSSIAQGDTTTMKASYAYGPVTVAYSNNDHATETSSKDQETTSFKLSYTVSDAISVSYGEETIDEEGDTLDAEFSKVSASYTSGGMTVTATSAEAKDALHGTATNQDKDYWSLGLSFAF